jgi:23S rRNA (cytosine1962-C5)-methyltransferase
MGLLRGTDRKPIRLQLGRDLVRSIKRGHRWVYADALRSLPSAEQGAHAVLLDNRGGNEIGCGFYDPQGSLALRMCTTVQGERLTNAWAARQMDIAITLRQELFDEDTNAYRLFNGEGDGLPGLVCDRYGDSVVLKLDGPAACNFWDALGIANWLVEKLGVKLVYERIQGRGSAQGRALIGSIPDTPQTFLEHGIRFTADLVRGQKTGFFLDQRENRQRMQKFVVGKRVLNAFGYTGGFSVYTGMGGAAQVTTLDTARPALDAANAHWALNGLPEERHITDCSDAFEFLDAAKGQGINWDIVILDPPSFAPSRKTLPQALNAYKKLIAAGAAVTQSGGILAAGSCSSHVSMGDFLQVCEEGISIARRQGITLEVHSQPADHPAPLAMPEFRYLKFVVLRVE